MIARPGSYFKFLMEEDTSTVRDDHVIGAMPAEREGVVAISIHPFLAPRHASSFKWHGLKLV